MTTHRSVQPLVAGPGVGHINVSAGDDAAAVTDVDGRQGDDVCFSVGSAAVTNAEVAELTVVRDDAASPTEWRVRIRLTDEGVDKLVDAMEACAGGAPQCPIHEGAPAGVLLLVLGDELLDVLPVVEQVQAEPTEIELRVRSEATATVILTYGRGSPPSAAT